VVTRRAISVKIRYLRVLLGDDFNSQHKTLMSEYSKDFNMKTASVLMSGKYQAVRLPKDFQFDVKEVDFQTWR
jgi:DNA-binding ferritin-like protein (Dps family)